MTHGSDRSDSFISMVLSLNGRVRPADLHSIPESERADALRAYLERHEGETALHIVGDELVAGDAAAAADAPVTAAIAPAADAPAAAATPAAPIASAAPSTPTIAAETPTGIGAGDLDLLLGGYDGRSDRDIAEAPNPAFAAQPRHADRGDDLSSPTAALATAGSTRMVPPAADETSSRRWLLWWLPTLILPLVGGAAAWFALRNSQIRAARAMLAVGIAIGMVASVLFLRYAEPLAINLNTNTKITLPSTKAKPDPAGAGHTPGSGTDSGGGASQGE